MTKEGGKLSDDNNPLYNPTVNIKLLMKKNAKAVVIMRILRLPVRLYDNTAMINNDSARIIIHAINTSWTKYSMSSIRADPLNRTWIFFKNQELFGHNNCNGFYNDGQ